MGGLLSSDKQKRSEQMKIENKIVVLLCVLHGPPPVDFLATAFRREPTGRRVPAAF